MDGDEDTPAIVVDNGSGMCKAGYRSLFILILYEYLIQSITFLIQGITLLTQSITFLIQGITITFLIQGVAFLMRLCHKIRKLNSCNGISIANI